MAAPPWSRWGFNLSLWLLFVAAAHTQVQLHLGGIFEDDAYFYFRIARNILEGRGSSFDAIDLTNGYHPGWMGFLLAALWPLHGWLDFDVAIATVTALPLLFFAFHLRSLPFAATLGASTVLGPGTEGLFAAVLAIMVARSLAVSDSKRTIVWAAILVVSRVDLIAWLALVGLWRLRRRESLLPLVLGAGFGLAMVSGIHLALVGHPSSISSTLKAGSVWQRDGAEFRAMLALNFLSFGNMLRWSLLGLTFGGVLWKGRKFVTSTPPFESQPAVWGGLGIYLLLHSLASDLRDWYFAVPLLFGLWALARLDEDTKMDLATRALWSALFVLPSAATLRYQISGWEEAQHHRKALDQLAQELPESSPLYVFDGSGFVGHVLAQHRVINGDGLVNSFEYAKLKDDPDKFWRYLETHRVRHYLSQLPDPRCITKTICCEESDIERVLQFPWSRWHPDKRVYRFREGYRCRIQAPK